ncbi:hypothetical protein P175DRAFT_0500516 [Aspergillus ochraceoroseus IBT 24754]|uniref:Uncharacterized protein n=1 Tax=Aspergillus ochraceoroseus IBT 24754 TaxID=1392256 RepID=A0A2T5LZC4_9EURO|nr:uncharacterized protein P175DRAFT_0500516 [Aspergillus ochraceoroseus IBT 24754]PTU21638.1 hypothetical protein P175DRAFT_0500516 [Aspergillus ochraceoroseus IBT 24754]
MSTISSSPWTMQPSSGRPQFYDLFRQEGLLVHPLLWTSRLLDILGCQFQDATTLPTACCPDDDCVGLYCAERANIAAKALCPSVLDMRVRTDA